MKISKWESLNKMTNGIGYMIDVKGTMITIRNHIDNAMVVIDTYYARTNSIVDTLSGFGFGIIEFIEPPKLSERAYHYVNYLPDDAWLATDGGSTTIFAYNSKPRLDSLLEWNGEYFTSVGCSLFPFITPDRAWSVKELRELEHE